MNRVAKSADWRELGRLTLRLAPIYAVIGVAANIVEALWGGTASFLFAVAFGIPVYFLFPVRLREGPWLRFLAVLVIVAGTGSLIATGAESAFAAPPNRCHPHHREAIIGKPAARIHCIELRGRER